MMFQRDFTGGGPVPKERFEAFWTDRPEEKDVKDFAESLVNGTITNIEFIDKSIAQAAEHWVLDRMATVDRNILRLAAFEIFYVDTIPPAVTINEAIEIAKKYSTSESASFINGILDRLAKGIRKK